MSLNANEIRNVFLKAVELQTTERRIAYLDQACSGDDAARRRVESLLNAHERPESLLDKPAIDHAAGKDFAPTQVEFPVAEVPGTIIGPYKLLEQIGEGGFGIVYMAEQSTPVRRKVALKILKPGMDTRQVIARFEAERQALALMDHPHIAKVYDGGATGSGRPYFVMEFVKGVPITDYCDEHRLTLPDRLELFVTVCQAIQHAHQKGIIHRDIKPSNALVALHDDKPLVKVIDFGIAKAVGGQTLTDKTVFTGFAQMVGTPLYMCPEQAELSGTDIDTRCDVYSLGVLLYELLTGTTPFDKERMKSAAYDEIRRIIREEEPQRPSTRLSELCLVDSANRRVGRSSASSRTTSLASISAVRRMEPYKLTQLLRADLDWIVMKALEKDRGRRYATALGLAADVQRYLADEPVEACPPSAAYRFRKFARRNKGALVTLATVASALIVAVVGLAVSNVLVTAERDEKVQALGEKEAALKEKGQALTDKEAALREARTNLTEAKRQEGLAQASAEQAQVQQKIAEDQERLARRRYYAAQMNLAMQAWRTGEVPRVLELLEGERPTSEEEDLRGFEWYYLWRLCHGGRRVPIKGHSDAATWVTFSLDGKTLASAGWDGTTRLWDTTTGRQRMVLRGHADRPWCVAFSPDGRFLATGGQETETVILWDAKTGQPLHSMAGPSLGLSFSPDSQTLAASAKSSMKSQSELDVKLWELKSGEERDTLVGAGNVVGYLPDGRTLVTMTGRYRDNGEIHFWDLESRARRFTIPVPGVATATLAADGARLATWGIKPFALWDCTTGQPLDTQANPPYARAMAFSPDGKKIATGGEDKIVTVWDLDTGRILAQDAHIDNIWGAAFSPDGKTLASSTLGGGINLWDMMPAEETTSIPNPDATTTLRFSSDGSSLLIGSNSAARSINVASGKLIAAFPSRGIVAASADASVLAGLTGDGKATVWDLHAERDATSWPVGPATGAALSPDGGTLATHQDRGEDNTVKLWNIATQRSTTLRAEASASDRGTVQCAKFSPDGMLVAAGIGFRRVTVWDVTTGRVKLEFDQPPAMTSVLSLAFSPDSRSLAVGTHAGTVTLWDVESGKRLASCKGHPTHVHALEFSPDGTTLATAGADRTVRLWDVLTGQERCAFIGHQAAVIRIAFSPDGSTLATAGSDAMVKLWRTATDPVALAPRMVKLSDDPLYPVANQFNRNAWVLATTENPQERDPSKAVQLATKATALMPQASQFWQTLGVAQFRTGQWQEAIASLEKYKELSGESSGWNWYWQAMALWNLGRKEEALHSYDLATKWTDQHAPQHLQLCRLRIEAAALLGLPAPAASPSLLPDAFGLDNQVAVLLRQRAALDERAKDVAQRPPDRCRQAGEYLRIAAGLSSLSAAVEAEATCRLGLDCLARMTEDSLQFVVTDDLAGWSHSLLSDLLETSGHFEEALAVRRKSLSHFGSAALDRADRPDYREAIAMVSAGLGFLLRRLGKPTEADEVEREGLSARQAEQKLKTLSSPDDLMASARPFAEKRDWKMAAEELDKGFRGQPRSHLPLCYAAALTRLLAGDIDGYASVIEHMPKRWLSYEWPHDLVRARTLHPRGTSDAGWLVALAQAAYDCEVHNWSAHNLGMAHYRAGKFDQALQRTEEALKLTEWYLMYPALAMMHHQLGHVDEARAWLDKAESRFDFCTQGDGEPRKVTNEPWQDWAYFEVMLLEARALIEGDKKE